MSRTYKRLQEQAYYRKCVLIGWPATVDATVSHWIEGKTVRAALAHPVLIRGKILIESQSLMFGSL
jgi:hypothetical protein